MAGMLAMTVSFFIWGYYYSGIEDFGLYYKLDVVDATLGLTFLPFVHLYFRSLTNETPIGRKEYLWFLPGLFVGISSMILYICMGDSQATNYMKAIITDHSNLRNYSAPVYKIHFAINVVLYYTILLIQIFFTLKYTLSGLTNYRQQFNESSSNEDKQSLNSIKSILVGVFVLSVIYLLGFFESCLFYHRYPLLIHLLVFGLAVACFYINHHVSQVKYSVDFLTINATMVETGCVQKSALIIKKGRRDEIIHRINSLLDVDEIFLKKDLRLDDVVRLTHVNRTYISLLISEEYNCSFSELVNRRRIDYAQKLVSSNPKLSHVYIAEKSGFAHASSFSRIFKKQTGMTFREWHRIMYDKPNVHRE